MVKSKTKSKTDIEDTPKGKTEKESIPKEPLIVEPLGKELYPRMEVTVDGTSATIGIRMADVDEDGKKSPLVRTAYCSPNVMSILKTIDSRMAHEKMISQRSDDFEPTLKTFIKMIKQHNTHIMRLAGALEDNDKLTR
jgi:hypothetical protein